MVVLTHVQREIVSGFRFGVGQSGLQVGRENPIGPQFVQHVSVQTLQFFGGFEAAGQFFWVDAPDAGHDHHGQLNVLFDQNPVDLPNEFQCPIDSFDCVWTVTLQVVEPIKHEAVLTDAQVGLALRLRVGKNDAQARAQSKQAQAERACVRAV